MHIQAAFQQLTKDLQQLYDSREAANIGRIVFEDVWAIRNIDRQDLFTSAQEEQLQQITAALLEGKPWQYVLGEADFYGLKLKVSPAVLIPRPETEELVHWIIENHRHQVLTLIDIGTGSGCIALALKKALPQAKVIAVDVSPAALAIAQENANRLDLDVQFQQLDLHSYRWLDNLIEIQFSKPRTLVILITLWTFLPFSIKVLLLQPSTN